MDLAAALAGAAEAVEQLHRGTVDREPLLRAERALRAPWHIVLVGRTSAGKSTLAGWLTGTPQPTGLAGVTQQIRPLPVGDDLVLVDTPGIDDPDRAVVELQPLLERADEVFWIVDGLQPGTASERDVLAHTLVEGTPLRILISKADLIEPDEIDAVVKRVRHLASRWSPVSVTAHDLRAAAVHGYPTGDLLHPRRPSPRQRRIVLEALDEVNQALAAQPDHLSLDTLLDTWREAVRQAVRTVEADIEAGRIHHKTDALAALGATVTHVHDAVRAVLGPLAPPRLPHPDPPTVTAMGQVLGGMSGQEGAARVLKAGAARWLAEGQLVLREWWADQGTLRSQLDGRSDLDARIAAIRAAI